MHNQDIIKNLGDYLNGHLKNGDKKDFESSIEAEMFAKKDNTAAEEEIVDRVVQNYRDLDLELELQRRTRKMLRQPEPKPIFNWRVAASTLGVCALLLLAFSPIRDIIFNPDVPNLNQILLQMEQPQFSGNLGGGEELGDSVEQFKTATSLFQAGNCQSSIKQFDNLLANADFANTHLGYQANIYTAYCQIIDDEPQAALQHLQAIPASTPIHEDALWYQGFAYLKQEDLSNARIIFNEISQQSTHPKQQEAMNILEQIDRMK